MTWAVSSGVVMPYFANTEGALAVIPAGRRGILASPLGHRRDKASPKDDWDMTKSPMKKPPLGRLC
jgi:hypothetical protein